jgi:DNA polymerase-3 subunit gamma/tau
MAHLSWYRKYRPQTFEDVVGQSHIERTLRNAVAEGVVAHAYLFCGPRGTGKTTTARILAKALNCESGPTATPDDTCEQCRAIAEGTHPDVLELDAASRTGVDDVREQIIGRVHFAPTRGAWKVYIIDEVHMLSTAAFNALLKTLEEPPSHTVFVLCTTHPQKVPETIHSRCQRFDFHRLSVEDIVSRLRTIADAESVSVPDGALTLIARHASGGMRDAITTHEQLASFGGGTIDLADVEGLLGEVDDDVLFEAAELVLERDVARAFRLVARLAEEGVDMAEFTRGLVRHFRDVFVLAAVGADEAVDATPSGLGRLKSQATRFGADRAARVLEVLGRLTTELRHTPDQRLAVEVALARMARPQGDLTLESLAERVAALEAGMPIREEMAPAAPPASVRPAPVAGAGDTTTSRKQEAERAGARAPRTSPTAAGTAVEAPSGAKATSQRAGQAGGPLDVASVKRAWPAILAEFKKLRPSRSYLFNGTEVEVDGATLVVEFPADQSFALGLAQEGETMELLKRCIATLIGQDPPIEYRLGRGGASAPARPAGPDVPPARDLDDTSPAATPEPDDLERRVIDELGAQVIEHRVEDSPK